ncbi:uncharacterized protein JCM15063_003678 [Sporobolomyces koalae]|uniref:uncharacterized protein n=1 Tax=Sporobolomyces koalae TaxID=500713 RepID=UPI00316BFDCE
MQNIAVPDFDALKRTFEAGNPSAGNGAPVPGANGVNSNGPPFQETYATGYGPQNGGLYPGGPFVPNSSSNGSGPIASNGAIPLASGAVSQGPNRAFSPSSTSPFLSGANSPSNGAQLANFGSPSSVPAGLPHNVNGGMGPGGPFPHAPSGFNGLTPMSPFMGMLSPMVGSPQIGANSFGMGYPISGQGHQGGMAGLSATQTPTGRTVYVGNLPSDASVDELLSQVRFGPIENIRILPEKSCAFISFLDPTTAAAFHSDALMRKIRLHDHDLKIGWGKPSAVSANVLAAVQQSGATRNVYIGQLDESVTEQTLRDDLSRFGPIDQVKIVRDKNIGFVHFLSIATAIKVVQNLPGEPDYVGRRVAYGKDRTAYVPKNQHQQQQHNMAAAAMGSMAANYGGFGGGLGFGSPAMGAFDGSFGQNGDPNAQPGNRTVYLGNIHPEVTTEEICNIIRGGILQQIRYIPDKHICFVTFVDPHCALAFFQAASFQGIALHNRRLKVGWGKPSGPTSPGIAMVVQAGGSRNVYVGNIEDDARYTDEKLRQDFGEYGDIELINSLKEKQCCFVNFTNITNAIKAIEGIKQHPDYQDLKISYGKDRCGGAPRAFRGFDLRNQQRPPPSQPENGHGHADFPRSPFTDAMSFPGSPNPEAIDGEAGQVPPMPDIGALVLDEEAAANGQTHA